MTNELPLLLVIKMIKNAHKKETEDKLYELWLIHYQISISNGLEVVPYEKMLSEVYQNKKTTTSSKEDIMKKFEKIVDNDKKKRGVD